MLTENTDHPSDMLEEVEKTRKWVNKTLFLIGGLAALTAISWGKDEIVTKISDLKGKQEVLISVEK